MSQNQLQDILLNRATSGQPDQPLPESIPGQQPGVLDNGMDFLLSALGIRGQKPGNPYTGAGAALGAAAPMLPFGKMAGVLKGLGGAPAEAEQLSPILQQIFSENPKARVLYERAMAAQAPDILAAKRAAQEAANQQRTVVNPARYARSADAHDALLDLTVGRPRPIPTDTGFATAIPTGQSSSQLKPAMPTNPEAPPIAGGSGSNVDANRMVRMQKAGLTEEMIRDIRQLGGKTAKIKYPNISAPTVWEIANGQIYNGVK